MNTPKSDFEVLAITYLSGYASDEETRRYNLLHETNADFRKIAHEVELWLAPLGADVPEVDAPEGLLDAILQDIDSKSISWSQVSEEQVIEDKPAFSSTAPLSANDGGAGKWKAFSAIASLVAIAAIGSHFINIDTPADLPTSTPQTAQSPTKVEQFLAVLADESKPELVAIIYNPITGKVVASLSNIVVPDDGDLQLWLIREGETAPQSLGILERARTEAQFEFEIPAALNPATDVLAISLEQKGGSPSAAPEGTVLFTGAISKLPRGI